MVHLRITFKFMDHSHFHDYNRCCPVSLGGVSMLLCVEATSKSTTENVIATSVLLQQTSPSTAPSPQPERLDQNELPN